MKTKKEKRYNISQLEYITMRRDRQAKRELKRLALELFYRVKKWK